MYDSEDLDAVVITTPNTFHEPAAVAALERDLSVLCEKPLADTLEAAESMAAAAEASEGVFMYGTHNRFSAGAKIVTALREEGRFGDVTHVEGWYVRRRGIPGIGSWFTSKELSGGGALIDIGVHLIDFALYLAGFPEPVEVSGVARTQFGNRSNYADPNEFSGNWETDEKTFDVDDSASALVRCASGTTLSFEVSWAANRDGKNDVVLRGTDAGARLGVGGDEVVVYESGTAGVDHFSDSTLAGSLDPSGHRAEVGYFLERVAAGTAPEMNTIDEALTVQRVLDGIYRSSERGGAVRLD